MANILIVEDDKNTRLLTATRLSKLFTIFTSGNGEEALAFLYKQKIDLIISDIMMPKMDGYQLLKEIRKEGFDTPVLLLTAKQEMKDKRIGFSLGSDDYLTKPINYEELLWRIQAILRRAKISTDKQIVFGSTVINAETLQISYKDIKIELSKKEFDLLFKLLSYPSVVFTKNQLLDDIWGYDSYSGEDTIKTHISKLRSKLRAFDDFSIVTVKGLGYKAELQQGEKDGK